MHPLREIHEYLFPERYDPDADVYAWTAGTIEDVAAMIERLAQQNNIELSRSLATRKMIELRLSTPGSASYRFEILGSIELYLVLSHEASKLAADAGSELLEENTDEARDALRERVLAEAEAVLVCVDATYTDPTGVTWSLHEMEA